MTAATSESRADSPRRGWAAAGVAVAAHAVVLLLAFVAGRVVSPSEGGGFEDLAAVAMTLLGGEALVGLACVIASMVLYRRGRRYTGVGLIGGWVVGLIIAVAIRAIA